MGMSERARDIHNGVVPDSVSATMARTFMWFDVYITAMAIASSVRSTMPSARVRMRLDDLATRLGDADWLDGVFSAGDLLMILVLRRLEGTGILEEYPNLSAYVARGEERPAYKRAIDAQLAVFTNKPRH